MELKTMPTLDKKSLSEQDIRSKFITPALVKAGWDVQAQIREEVSLTKGRVIVSGRICRRGEAKRADYLLHYKPNLPLAIIEAKDNNHTIGAGMQQALECHRGSAAEDSAWREILTYFSTATQIGLTASLTSLEPVVFNLPVSLSQYHSSWRS
jgi:type I site-specific restriction endonuclease